MERKIKTEKEFIQFLLREPYDGVAVHTLYDGVGKPFYFYFSGMIPELTLNEKESKPHCEKGRKEVDEP